jgi:hypothetical protein
MESAGACIAVVTNAGGAAMRRVELQSMPGARIVRAEVTVFGRSSCAVLFVRYVGERGAWYQRGLRWARARGWDLAVAPHCGRD